MAPGQPDEARGVAALYRALLDAWNRRDGAEYGALFAADGNTVGFDGSQVDGRPEIASHLGAIFAEHQTPAYVGIVREVRFPAPGVAILRAVSGLVPPGQSDINPALNAIQTLVAVRRDGHWRVEMFHNTPAAFHGRPELSNALTAELRAVLRNS
jgi:uncharacterized protein (TIGR02246 family)